MTEESLFVVRNFGSYLNPKSYSYADLVIAWLCEIRDVFANTGRTILFLGPHLNVPASLADEVTMVSHPLPDDHAIEQSIQFIADGQTIDNYVLPNIVVACRGMTQQQFEDRTALALLKFKTLNKDATNLILHEKVHVIRNAGLLKYFEPLIGGLEQIGR